MEKLGKDKRLTRSMLSIALTLVMVIGLLPIPGTVSKVKAETAGESVSYIDADGEVQSCEDYQVVSGSMGTMGEYNKTTWYVVKGAVESEQLDVEGTVNLILCDDSNFKIDFSSMDKSPLQLRQNATLNIYCQSEGTGLFDLQSSKNYAIGGTYNTKIKVYGGNVIAKSTKQNGTAIYCQLCCYGGDVQARVNSGQAIEWYTPTLGSGMVMYTGSNETNATLCNLENYSSYVNYVHITLNPNLKKVTYNGNGNTGGSVPTEARTLYEKGTSATVPGNTGGFIKSGYAFNGWNTKADGTGVDYAPGASIEINDNLTLYAKWIKVHPTVQYTVDAKPGLERTLTLSSIKDIEGFSPTILNSYPLDFFSTKPTISNGSLSFTVSTETSLPLTVLTLTVSSSEYKDFTVVILINKTDKIPQDMTFEQEEAHVTYGGTYTQVAGTTMPEESKPKIYYSSSDTSVATVNKNTGEVTARKVGTAVITASEAGNSDYMPATATYNLTVDKRDVTVSGIKAGNKIYDGTNEVNEFIYNSVFFDGKLDGDSLEVVATGIFDDGDENVNNDANVGNDKTVKINTLVLSGESVDNYRLAETGQQETTTANITKATYKGANTASKYTQKGAGGVVDLSDMIVGGGKVEEVKIIANEDQVFKDTGMPSVDESFKLNYAFKADAEFGQQATVRISVSSTNYNTYYITVTLNVTNLTTQTISFDHEMVIYSIGYDVENPNRDTVAEIMDSIMFIEYGHKNFIRTATAEGGNPTITYSSSDEGVVSVNETTGEVTILNPGTAVITAYAAPTEGYTSAYASYTINVDKRLILIHWEGENSDGNSNLTYNGNPQVPSVTVGGKADVDVNRMIKVTVTGQQTNVGKSYTAVVTEMLGETEEDTAYIKAHYKLPNNSTYRFGIDKKQVVVKGGITCGNKVYDGTTTVPEVNINNSAVTFEGKVNESHELSVTSVTAEFQNAYVGDEKYVFINNVVLGGKDANNYSARFEGTVQASITPKAITAVSGIKAADKTYDGDTKATLNYDDVTVNGTTADDKLSVKATGTFADKNAGNKNVEITDITLTGENAGNYTLTGATLQTNTTATINKKTVGLNWSNTSFDYDGESHIPSATATGVVNGDTCSVTVDGAQTNAGTYDATATGLTGEGSTNYVLPTENKKQFVINKKKFSPTVSIEGWTYGGPKKQPTVEGNISEGAVSYSYKKSGESEYKQDEPDDAGNYTVKATIAATANYAEATATKEFTIAKADITPSVTLEGWTYGETAATPSVGGNTGNGTVTYKYKVKNADDGTYTATVPSNAGQYTVKAEIAATTNYNSGSATADFTISKADGNISFANDTVNATYGGSVANALTKVGDGVVSYSSDNVDVATVDASTGAVTIKGVGNAAITATVADSNNYAYASKTQSYTLSVAKADINPQVSISGWTYGGTANEPSVSGNSGNGTVTYNYKVQGAADDTYVGAVPTNAGEYTVKATILDTTNYNGGNATADFTIAKAEPTAAAPTGLTASYGQTLANVTLTNPGGNTPGTWAWVQEGTTSVGNAGSKTFKANFTPENTTNYKTKENVDVTVTVGKADPIAEAPTGSATYGQKLKDVTLTNPEGNTPGTWSWVDSGETSVGDAGNNTFKANYTPNDTTNFNGKENVDVSVTVEQANNPAEITSTATVMRGGHTVDLSNNVKLNGAIGAVSYAISGEDKGCTLIDGVLTSGTEKGTVTVNVTIAAAGNYKALESKPITVTITDKQTQTITAADVTATFGDTDKTVSATVTTPETGGGEITYSVKDGSGDYISVNGNTGALTITKVPEGGKAYVTVTAAETADYEKATKDITVTISKANSAVETAPAAKTLKYNGSAQELVTAGDAIGGTMYYAIGSDSTSAPEFDGTSELSEKKWSTSIPKETNAGIYYVWYKVVGDASHNDGDICATPVSVDVGKADAPQDIEAAKKPSGITGLAYTGEELTLVNAPTSALDGYTVKYSKDGGDTWSESVPKGTNAGSYTVMVKYVGDANHKDFNGDNISVSIGKMAAPASIEDANKPSAKDGLIYTGFELQLVNAPQTPITGYTVKYSKDNEDNWSETIPTETNSATYTVKVKYAGDANHTDFDGTDISVAISKATLTNVTVTQSGTLTYTGQPQTATVTPGATAVNNQTTTFKYSATEDGTYESVVPAFTDAGPYTVYFKATAPNHNEASGSFTVTIGQATRTLSDNQKPTAKELTYSGSEQALLNGPASDLPAGYTIEYKLSDSETWSGTIPNGTDAVSYTVNVRYVSSNSNYATFNGTDVTVLIGYAPLDYVEVVQSGTLKYTGSQLTAEITKTPENGKTTAGGKDITFTYSATEVGEYQETIPTFKYVGEYTVYYKANAKYHNEKSGSFVVTIESKNAGSDMTAIQKEDEELIYTGSPLKPTLIVKDGEKSLTENEDYSVTYKGTGTTLYDANSIAPTNVGTYEAKLNFDNYSGTKKVSFEIKPRALTEVTLDNISLPYNGSNQTVSITAVKAGDIVLGVNDYKVVTVTDSNPVSVLSATAVGTYTVKVSADSENFKGDASVTWSIVKGTIVLTEDQKPTANTLTFTGSEQTLITAPTADLPAGYTMKYAVTTTDTAPEDTAYTYTNTSLPKATATGTYYVWYKADGDDNLNPIAADKISVTIGNKDDLTNIQATQSEVENLVYDGSSKVPTIIVKDGDTPLTKDTDYTVKYVGVDPTVYVENTTAPVLPGSYKAVITLKGNYSGTKDVAFTISRKPVKVSGITASDKVYDGTTTATISTADAVFDGKLDGDKLTVSAEAAFADANAGEGKSIAISGLVLGGENADNYVISTTDSQTTTTANISKRNVTLTSGTASKAYDGTELTNDTVTVSGDGFVEGEGATYNVTGTQKLPGESDNVFTFTLDDGTKSDNYTISTVKGKLTISGRTEAEGNDKKYEINVEVSSDEVKYNGQAQSISGFKTLEFTFNNIKYTVSGLTATTTGTDVGIYTSTVTGTPVVKDASGNVLTDQFVVTTTNGTLTINKRNVTLMSETETKTYDGKALTNKAIMITGDGWAANEGATYNVTGSQKTVGSSSNAFTYNLKAGTKADNYNITKTEGTLTVTNREAEYQISPQAASETVTYDGETHTVTGLVTDTFEVDGNTYTVSGLIVSGTGTDVGKYTVSVSGTAKVLDSDKNDVTSQFSVTPINGELTIGKRSVLMTSASGTKEYDGAALTDDTVTVTGDGFVDGQGADYNVTGTRTLVGTSENAFTYTLKDGTKAENYDVSTSYGTLTINNRNTKYSVTLTGNSGSEKYDGTAKTVNGYTIGSTPVNAEGVTAFKSLDGKYYTISGMTAGVTGTDAGEYAVNVTGTPVIKDSDGNDVTEQFAIVVEIGKLTIAKRSVTFTSATAEKAYDGTVLADSKVTVSGDGFIEGESATYIVTGSQTLPGESDNKFTYALNEGTKADNYDINKVYGKLKVDKSDSSASVSAVTDLVYDGTSKELVASDEIVGGTIMYRLGTEGEWQTEIPKGTDAGTYNIYYYIKADDNHNDEGSKEEPKGMVKTVINQASVDMPTETFTASNATETDIENGMISGFDETKAYQISADGGETWTDVTGKTSIDAKAGTYLIRYAQDENHEAGKSTEVTIGVASRTEGNVKFNSTGDGEGGQPVSTIVETAQSSNIEEFAKAQIEEGKDVKVELEINPVEEEMVKEDSVAGTKEVVKEVFAEIEEEEVVTEYLEIDLTKYVNSKEDSKISDTENPIEIALAFDTTKAKNPIVIRNHNGEAVAFTKLSAKPAEGDYKDATYYIDMENGIIYLYSQFFSDYAIVYAKGTTYSVNINIGGKILSQVVSEDGKIKLPTDIEKEGAVFGGWFKDEEYKNEWNEETDTVNSDLTIYAKWNVSVTGVDVEVDKVSFDKAGDTAQIKAKVSPDDAADNTVTYTTSDEKVAKVDANGKITAVANGTATITVTTVDGGKTASVKVTVAIPDDKKDSGSDGQGTGNDGKSQDDKKTGDDSKKTPDNSTEQSELSKAAIKEKAELSINAGLKVSQTGSKINIKWGKVDEADGYYVYVAYCGTKFGNPAAKLNDNTKTSIVVTKIDGKKLNLKKNYKVYISAYKLSENDKELLAKTITGHIVGRKNTAYTNVKSIKLSKSKYTLSVGKTAKIKAKTILVDKTKKQLSNAHATQFRYASSNKKIATVSKKGKIKGISKGTCTVYVYARNGYAKKISVTVK